MEKIIMRNNITKVMLVFLSAVVMFSSQAAMGLTIVSPNEGQLVYQGDRLEVIVKPDIGEEWEEVYLEIYPMPYNAITKEYKQEIGIPTTKIGTISLSVAAYDKNGKEVEIKRSLFVKMPPNVVLQSIVVENIMILFKTSSAMNPDDKKKVEEDQITVAGVYSDGVNRQITPSTMGTTYVSSNEKIVKVSTEGKVLPQSLGTANITVRNGKYSATVKVIVKLYKQ